jgi:ABC-type bacteriocin/lantibiotic exporter with double-glycine peptidase domain
LPIEHYPQEEDAGCLAACAQMVLTDLGINISQAELNQLFELTPLGVPLSRLTRLDQHGVNVAIHRNGILDDLIRAVDQNTPPIVFIRTGQLSYWQEDTQHALVVRGYDGPHLLFNDPAFPDAPQTVLADELMLAWDEFDNAWNIAGVLSTLLFSS